MKGFSIIIVTWNGLHHLQNFLPSVVRTKYDDFEIILADNNSTDGSKEWVKENFPSVKIAAFDNNYGYTGGNNRAVPYAEKEILIFLNNDVEVPINWLDGINRAFDDTSVKAVQPKVKSYEEKDYFEYAGAAGGYLDRFGFPFCRGRVLSTCEEDVGQYEEPEEIVWASGAALAIDKTKFEDLGGFDEDFEFHMEEIDLCWRLRNTGHKVMYTPESTVYHLGGGSLPMGSSRKVYYNFRNNLYMLLKNLPKSKLWYKIPLRMIIDDVAFFRALLTGKWSEAVAIKKAHIHFLSKFSKVRRKRKSITRDYPAGILSTKSIIVEYFLKGNKKFSDFMK